MTRFGSLLVVLCLSFAAFLPACGSVAAWSAQNPEASADAATAFRADARRVGEDAARTAAGFLPAAGRDAAREIGGTIGDLVAGILLGLVGVGTAGGVVVGAKKVYGHGRASGELAAKSAAVAKPVKPVAPAAAAASGGGVPDV